MSHVQASEERRAGGRTNTCPRVRGKDSGAFPAKPIEVRRLDQLLSVHTEVSLSDVIGKYEIKIRFFSRSPDCSRNPGRE